MPDLSSDVSAATHAADTLHDLAPDPVRAATKYAEPSEPTKARLSEFRMSDGGICELDLSKNVKDAYRDEYTQRHLAHSHLMDAIHDELSHVNGQVWVAVPFEEAHKDQHGENMGTRWVLCNSSANSDPDVTARLVAQEVRIYNDDSVYAATPPREAKRPRFSQRATEQWRPGSKLELSFIDVREAYCNCFHPEGFTRGSLLNLDCPKTCLHD